MANNDEGSQSSESTKSGFGGKQWNATGLTILVVVFVFAVVFPSLGTYSDAWTATTGMSTAWIIALALSTVGVIFIHPWPFQEALPGLNQFIPIPPGGLGTADAILIGLLTRFGMSSSDAIAADLIWRAATFLPQVLIGIGTLLVWRRHQREAT